MQLSGIAGFKLGDVVVGGHLSPLLGEELLAIVLTHTEVFRCAVCIRLYVCQSRHGRAVQTVDDNLLYAERHLILVADGQIHHTQNLLHLDRQLQHIAVSQLLITIDLRITYRELVLVNTTQCNVVSLGSILAGIGYGKCLYRVDVQPEVTTVGQLLQVILLVVGRSYGEVVTFYDGIIVFPSRTALVEGEGEIGLIVVRQIIHLIPNMLLHEPSGVGIFVLTLALAKMPFVRFVVPIVVPFVHQEQTKLVTVVPSGRLVVQTCFCLILYISEGYLTDFYTVFQRGSVVGVVLYREFVLRTSGQQGQCHSCQ